MRATTDKKHPRGRPKKDEDYEGPITKKLIVSQKRRGKHLCGDLSELKRHWDSRQSSKHDGKCVVCGLASNTVCGICGVRVHCMPNHGKAKDKACFFDYHSDACFGLTRADWTDIHGKSKKEWKPPTCTQINQNAKRIKDILAGEEVSDEEEEPAIYHHVTPRATPSPSAAAAVTGTVDPSTLYEPYTMTPAQLKKEAEQSSEPRCEI